MILWPDNQIVLTAAASYYCCPTIARCWDCLSSSWTIIINKKSCRKDLGDMMDRCLLEFWPQGKLKLKKEKYFFPLAWKICQAKYALWCSKDPGIGHLGKVFSLQNCKTPAKLLQSLYILMEQIILLHNWQLTCYRDNWLCNL